MKAIRDHVYARVVDMLATRYKHRLFLDLAKSLGVEKITVDGRFGYISGRLDDRVVFQTYFRSGIWQKAVSDVFSRFFATNGSGTFIDIGANIGLTTVPVARNPKVVCHAFEPDLVNFALLQENVNRNVKTCNAHLHNVALFSEETELTIELCPHNHGAHRVRNAGAANLVRRKEPKNTVVVPGRRLDCLLDVNILSRPIAIKIDTEGSEYHIYKGGRDIFRAAKLAILEYWPYAIKGIGGNVLEMIDLMEQDFTHGRIMQNSDQFEPSEFVKMSQLAEQLRLRGDRMQKIEEEVFDIVLVKFDD